MPTSVMYLKCRSNPTSGSSRTCYAPRAAPAFYMHHIYRAPRRLLTCIAFLRFRARMSVLMRTRPVDVGQRFWDFGCMYRVGPCPVMVTVLALCTHVDSTRASLSLSLSLCPTICFTSSDSVGYSLGAQDVLQLHSHGAETFLVWC